MSKALAVVVGVILLVLLVLYSTTYTVRFHEVAIKTRYGRASAQSVVNEPGLHFRIPFFADRVTRFDTRLQLVETPKVEVPTADGQSVVVQAFLLWKVGADDALKFFESFPSKGALEEAQRILEGRLRTAVKGSLSRYAFDDLIGPASRLGQAEKEMLHQLASIGSMGIEPVTVGISQVLLPPRTTTAVLARMERTRVRLADAERSRGEAEAVGIESEANTLADKLQAFVEQRAEEIKATANVRAAEYLSQMSEDENLAIFLVWLKAFEEGLQEGVTFFLSDEYAPWHLMNLSNQTDAGHIPQPKKKYLAAPAEDRVREEGIAAQPDGETKASSAKEGS
ncbi:MAG: SPFH domain-containing protein [Planctomycetota bacterium]|nr:SPFH domain-containing protein [Planctomycetota bacterium]